jgi:hypothetical protein
LVRVSKEYGNFREKVCPGLNAALTLSDAAITQDLSQLLSGGMLKLCLIMIPFTFEPE